MKWVKKQSNLSEKLIKERNLLNLEKKEIHYKSLIWTGSNVCAKSQRNRRGRGIIRVILMNVTAHQMRAFLKSKMQNEKINTRKWPKRIKERRRRN